MGTASSRRGLPSAADTRPLAVSRESDASPWKVVYSELLASWKYCAVLWGFDPRIDYTSNVKTRLQPWCTSGRYFSVKHNASTPHLLLTLTEACFKQDTHIRLPAAYHARLHSEPEPSDHYLKPIQVVGYRDGIAIVQVNCIDLKMEFLVVHMKTETVLGVYKTDDLNGKHYLCDCILSPDLSSFIVKPNAMYVLNFCRGEYRNVMKVISCRQYLCPVLKTLFDNMAVRPFVAYDPRYKWRRIAVGNYIHNSKDVVCIYDIEREQMVVQSDPSHYQTTHNIVFSPDGVYLGSLILGRSVKDGLFNFPRVLIYSSSDLNVLHVIRTEYLAEVPTLAPAALFPLFSDTGTHLAIAYGEHGTFYQQVCGVHVYRVSVLLDLQSLCRLTIREHYDCQDVGKLPLPSKLKAYLRFQPFVE